MDLNITKETVVLVLLYIVGAAVALTKILDVLQSMGVIKKPENGEPGATGTWNQVLALVLAIVVVILQYLGAGASVQGAEEAGAAVAATLVSAGIIAGLAYLFHQIVLRLEGLKPKAPQPTAKVTVETSGGATASAAANAQPAASPEVYAAENYTKPAG